jgi:hypothetical protein
MHDRFVSTLGDETFGSSMLDIVSILIEVIGGLGRTIVIRLLRISSPFLVRCVLKSTLSMSHHLPS